MHGTSAFLGFTFLLFADLMSAAAPQNLKSDLRPPLKVSLRTEEGLDFAGISSVQVIGSEGYTVTGTATGAEGETIFPSLSPGTYVIEASAPGFQSVRQETHIEAGNRFRTVFLVMRPAFQGSTVLQRSPPLATEANEVQSLRMSPGIDEAIPNTEANVKCPLSQVVTGAGRRVKELAEDLERIDAAEHVEHFSLKAGGLHGAPEARTFDYMVTVTPSDGVVRLEEYRNGNTGADQFPAGIATTGIPGMAFIFHPAMLSGFDLLCEGLGQWDGNTAWQVHFAQRLNRPNRLRAYFVNQKWYPTPLKGRVWIDAATFQIRHIETELMTPVLGIKLREERMAIDYGLVQFRIHPQQLWLPLRAEVYWDFRGHQMYRRHTFTDFKIFRVETAQHTATPKESYCFTNTSDHDVAGTFTVSPVAGISRQAVSVPVLVPNGRSVCVPVGEGKAVGIPADEVGSATFLHNGLLGSITAEATLVKQSALDLVAESDLANP
jgi:hypothetical protein